jgi:hypothetical protein
MAFLLWHCSYLISGDSNIDPRFTWKGVRVCNEDKSSCYKYAVHCNGENELYNLTSDPHELENLTPSWENSTVKSGFSPIPSQYKSLVDRLDAIMSAAAICKGVECIDPMSMLHKNEKNVTFEQAMHPSYNDHYSQFQKFKFLECTPFFLPENEFAFGRQLERTVPGSVNDLDLEPRAFNSFIMETIATIEQSAEPLSQYCNTSLINSEALLKLTRGLH